MATTTMGTTTTGNRRLYWGLFIALIAVLIVAWAINNSATRSGVPMTNEATDTTTTTVEPINPPAETAPMNNTNN